MSSTSRLSEKLSMLYTTHARNTLVRFTDGKFKNCIGVVHSANAGPKRIRALYYSGIVFVPIVELDFKIAHLRGTRSMQFENEPASSIEFLDILNEDALEFFADKEDDGKTGRIVKFPNNTMGFIIAIGTGNIYNGFTFKPVWFNRKNTIMQDSGVDLKIFDCTSSELSITKHDALI